MSRQARTLSKTGLYHIIFRGINKQNIFDEASDYIKLKEILKKVKSETNFELYAYCLMTNHVHLFIKEQNPGEISKIMTKILSSYAVWFNKKYQRSGSLFENRYKSEPVEDERYLIALIRYIHQNPIAAHISKTLSGYAHSSYHEYTDNSGDLTDIDFLLDMLHDDREIALSQFREISKITETEDFDIRNSRKKTTGQIRRIILIETGGIEPGEIKKLDRDLQNTIIKKLVSDSGLSKSEIQRATGLSRDTIIRICNGTRQKLPRPQTVGFSDSAALPTHLM